MATQSKKAALAVATTEEPVEAPSPPAAPPQVEHRATVPKAPVGDFRDQSLMLIQAVRNALQQAVFDRSENAALMAMQAIPSPWTNCRPEALSYRAEALDYLQGRVRKDH
jgi:hypothetical protein